MTAALAKPCSGAALARSLRDLSVTFTGFRGQVAVDLLGQEDWASVTFCGARHRLCLRLEGEGAVCAAADILGALSDLDLPMPGHIVADLSLIAEARRDDGAYAWLELEALTIADE